MNRTNFRNIVIVLVSVFFSTSVYAGKYWHSLGDSWKVYFDNGQTYISSTNIPSHCAHSRAQMDRNYYSDAEYYKNMYAYILSGTVTGKKLSIVLESTQSTCEFFGANLD